MAGKNWGQMLKLFREISPGRARMSLMHDGVLAKVVIDVSTIYVVIVNVRSTSAMDKRHHL